MTSVPRGSMPKLTAFTLNKHLFMMEFVGTEYRCASVFKSTKQNYTSRKYNSKSKSSMGGL